MRSKLTKITLAAGIALAITFTLNACSSSDDDPTPPVIISSDSGDSSSSGSLNGAAAYNEYMKQKYKYYSTPGGRCENGVVEKMCGYIMPIEDGEWYNPLTHFCEETYDPIVGMAFEVKAPQCGGITYEEGKGGEERCQNDVPEQKCETKSGDVWFNVLTHYCNTWCDGTMTNCITEVKAFEQCGGYPYHAEWTNEERCENGVLERKCDFSEEWHNLITHACPCTFNMLGGGGYTCEVKAKTKCGS
jgi:hypothetical protein